MPEKHCHLGEGGRIASDGGEGGVSEKGDIIISLGQADYQTADSSCSWPLYSGVTELCNQ